MSLCGMSCLSRLVNFLKLLTLSFAIFASSSGVVSLTTTVKRHLGLSMIPDLPLAWYDTCLKYTPFPTKASATRKGKTKKKDNKMRNGGWISLIISSLRHSGYQRGDVLDRVRGYVLHLRGLNGSPAMQSKFRRERDL